MKLSKPEEIEAEPGDEYQNGDEVSYPFSDEQVSTEEALERMGDQFYSEIDLLTDRINELEERVEELEGGA